MKPEILYISRGLNYPIQFLDTYNLLAPDYFEDNRAREYFEAMAKAVEGGATDDLFLATRKELRKQGTPFHPGETDLLNEPIRTLTSPILSIVDTIISDYQERRTKELGQFMTFGKTTAEEAAEEIAEIQSLSLSTGEDSLKDVAERTIKKLQERIEAFEANKPIPGKIYTGITDLDAAELFWAGSMSGIAARPAMGKSTLARSAALGMAKMGQPVLMYTLEMTPDQVLSLMACEEAEVNSLHVRKGDISNADLKKYLQALDKIAKLPITIEETGTLARFISSLHSWLRKRDKAGKPGAVFIDYVQQMSDPSRKYGRRDSMLEKVSNTILCQTIKHQFCSIPIFQLNRGVESRGGDKRPGLSDLKDCGGFEQDLMTASFIHRPEYYGFETDSEGNSTVGLAEVIVRKNRFGPLFAAKLQFVKNLPKFQNWNTTPFGQPSTDNPITIPPINREGEQAPF